PVPVRLGGQERPHGVAVHPARVIVEFVAAGSEDHLGMLANDLPPVLGGTVPPAGNVEGEFAGGVDRQAGGGVSTRVIVTGGAGFIGTLLARRLLAEPVTIGDGSPAPVDELVLADLAAPPPDVAADPRVRAVTGDLAGTVDDLGEADAIFHLAGVVSGAAEADFDLGMHGMRAILEHARRHRTPPVVVFSSSLAVFGQDPAADPIGTVGDDTLPRPQ